MKTRRLMSNSRNAPVVKLPFAGQDDTDKSSIGSCSKFCKHLHYVCWFSFFWASSSFIHILATLDFGAGVEQTFDCLIVENRQAVQSTERSMDWTLEDNMVDGLFFCATLTGRRGGHTPFVQAGAETSGTFAEAVKPDPGSSWEGHSGWVDTGVWN